MRPTTEAGGGLTVTGSPAPAASARADAVGIAVGFARTLRAAGVGASPDRVHSFMTALDHVDATRRNDVYWAGRLTLCGNHEDLERYDRVFAAYFEGQATPVPATRQVVTQPIGFPAQTEVAAPEGRDEDGETNALVASASTTEVLRRRDVATLTAEERAELQRLLALFRLPGERRRTRRWEPARRGPVDRARTVRTLLRSGGEPARLRRRHHRAQPRRVVLLVDVSGSMSPYADALLRFTHAACHRGPSKRTEVFTIGTRLTRVTRELSHRDPDTALAEVTAAVVDWSGGTRLGEQLKAFLDRWGQRGMARGAVVVVLSDGWERGDCRLLGEQMQRLARLAHRVVWANPRKGREGFAPLVGGLIAALPHVDDFVSGHSMEALEHLARVVAGQRRRASASEASPVGGDPKGEGDASASPVGGDPKGEGDASASPVGGDPTGGW